MQQAGKIFRRTFEFEHPKSSNGAVGDGVPPATALSIVKTRASIWNLPSFMEATDSSLPGADTVNDDSAVAWDKSVSCEGALNHVATAVQVADMAVKMDRAGDILMAARMYKRAIVTMVLTIEFLATRNYNDLALYDSLHMTVDRYQGRVNVLERRAWKQQEQRQNRQSRVPFVPRDPDATSSTGKFEEAPENDAAARRPFWKLRLVHRSILFGGFVSPTVYVPRDVWRQHNVPRGVVPALSIKIGMMENLLLHIQNHVVPVCDLERCSVDGTRDELGSSADAVIVALEQTAAHLRTAQTEIARSLSFVSASSSSLRHSTSSDSSRHSGMAVEGPAGSSATPESPLPVEAREKGRMFASTFSRVVDSALTTYKRAEAAVPGRVSTETLAHYAELVSEVCEKSQRFDQWLQAVPLRDAEEPGSKGSNGEGQSQEEEQRRIRALLESISALYRDVVCEVVLRDLQNLVERYIKKMRKSFARMHWDEDAEGD